MRHVDIVKITIKKCLNLRLGILTSKINVLLTIIYVKYDSVILSWFCFIEFLKQNFAYHYN